jgi:sigma-B regulation protein RsbU (phosphoserine phosphatase)
MSLRRRLQLVFLAYLAIIVAGVALVVWTSVERDQETDTQTMLVETSSLSARDRAALVASQDRIDDIRTRFRIGITVVLGAALTTTVAAAVLVRRWVVQPIDRVTEAVRGAREGELGVIPPAGPPEIAELARGVDAMRLSRNRALFDALRARETIEQSAPIVMGLRSALAAEDADLPGEWTVAGELQPAEGVIAGDCYDLIELGPADLGFILVDISGHGAVSGLLALRCRELLRAGLRSGFDPGDAVRWSAAQLDDLGDESFLSAFVGVVDLNSGKCTYASAGHPPALLCNAGGVATELGPTGPIVGPFDGPWTSSTFTVDPGDTLAIYTDGVIEVRNAEKEEFGVDRLRELVCAATCDEAAAISKRIIEDVTLFAPGRVHDDATIVLLCRGPRG